MEHLVVFGIAFLFACGFVFLGGFLSEMADGVVGGLLGPLDDRWGTILVITLFLFLYIRHVARLKTQNHALRIIVHQYEKAIQQLKGQSQEGDQVSPTKGPQENDPPS